MSWAWILSFKLSKRESSVRKAAPCTIGGLCGVIKSCKRSLAYKTIRNLGLSGFIFKRLYIFIIMGTSRISDFSQRDCKL